MTTTKVYDMKQIANETRAALKSEFPTCKFSVTVRHFSGGREMSIALMSAPESPWSNPETEFAERGYVQLNQYYPDRWVEQNGLTKKAAKMLAKVNKIANTHNWDNSDIQTDYFDVNYYFHLDIGKWDRPFQISN